MATVGNLFVNIRGKTEKFERDLKRSTRRVSKSFARDQERAMIQLREARERVGRMTTASPERFGAAMTNLRKAEHNVRMAESRQSRMEAWRRAYENRKQRLKDKQTKRWSIEYEIYKRKRLAHEEHMNRRRDRLRQRDLLRREASKNVFGRRGIAMQAFQSSPLAAVTTVLGAIGLTIQGLKAMVNFARRGSQMTEQFKFAGPMGGEIARTEAAKILQRLEFAKRPDVSGMKLFRARTELERERSEMEASSAYDLLEGLWNTIVTTGSQFVMYGPGGYGQIKALQSALRITGLTGQGP